LRTLTNPTLEEQIRDAERDLGLRLPAKLRERLLRNNLGDLSFAGETWHLLPVWDPSSQRSAKRSSSFCYQPRRLPDLYRACLGFARERAAVIGTGRREPRRSATAKLLHLWSLAQMVDFEEDVLRAGVTITSARHKRRPSCSR
jgi:hypothetical protein